MIPIERNTIDWNAVKADFLSGSSYGVLSKKYGVTKSMVYRKSQSENWAKLKKRIRNETERKTIEKVSDVLSDNAAVAAEIKSLLLRKLRKEILSMPDSTGSEMYQNIVTTSYDDKKKESRRSDGGKRYKLRDFTLAYKDLTEDMPKEADTTTLDKLDALLQEAWDAAYR